MVGGMDTYTWHIILTYTKWRSIPEETGLGCAVGGLPEYAYSIWFAW
jgi:hypothetical protein